MPMPGYLETHGSQVKVNNKNLTAEGLHRANLIDVDGVINDTS
jgi:hypothetical protein